MTDNTDNDSDSDIAEQRSEMWAGELEETDSETSDAKDTMDANDSADNLGAGRAVEDEKVVEGNGSSGNTMDDNNSTVGNLDAKGAKDTKDITEWDVDSIRDEWNPNSVRLPDSIQDSFATEHKRLDWLLEQTETEFTFTKDRYYKPLVIALGVRAIQEKDSDEIVELVKKMEQDKLLDE